MADFEVQIDENMEALLGDVEMGGEEVVVDANAETAAPTNGEENGVPLEEEEDLTPGRVPFVDYLKSPVVNLVIGEGDNQARLIAHQALLVSSPFFEDICSRFEDDTVIRRIDMFDEDLDAVGCFLEFLYTGEYYPQKLPGSRGLQPDPSIPEFDETGDQLLKHARVYTLADKLELPKLKLLAHSKIHCVNSSAKGEIAYARYVYSTTPKDDDTIRKPVASFWAQRSHVLRREAEEEFRGMCLEFPQFGFDVLSRVLDEKLKNERLGGDKLSAPSGSRKRQRQSGHV